MISFCHSFQKLSGEAVLKRRREGSDLLDVPPEPLEKRLRRVHAVKRTLARAERIDGHAPRGPGAEKNSGEHLGQRCFGRGGIDGGETGVGAENVGDPGARAGPNRSPREARRRQVRVRRRSGHIAPDP